MKKSLNVLACTIGASALWGAVTSVSDITKMPVSGTEGRIEYSGVTDVVAADLALAPAANKAATFMVVKQDTCLTFSGKLSATGGAFVKSGPGSLKLVYPGSFTLGETAAETQKSDLDLWDEGGVASKGFTSLTVADGALEVGMPGSSVSVKGGAAVGVRYAAGATPSLKIAGGMFKANALYVDRGYSTSSRNLTPAFEVSNCATAVFDNVYTDSADNTSSFGKSIISVSGVGSLLRVTGYCSIGLNRNGTNTLNTLDGASFEHTATSSDWSSRIGLEIGGTENDRGGGVRNKRTVWNIDGGTGLVYAAYLNRGSEINVKNGGMLKLD